MPDPVIESITPTTNIAPADATLDVTLDNADSADDLLLMFLSCHVGVLSTPPTGWTELGELDGGNFSLAAFYKKATGSEGATAVVTAAATPSAFAAQVYRISNWDTTELPVARTFENLGTTAAPNPSSFTAWGWGAGDNLFINAIGFADDAETVTGWPSGFTDGTLDTTADNGIDESAQCASCYLFDNVSTTVNCGAYTLSGADGVVSTTVAILGGAASGATVTNLPLVDLDSSAQASLTSLKWSWFDQADPKDFAAPTDQGTAEITDGSGQLSLALPNSTLTTTQTGFLVLRDSTNNYIGSYRVAVD